ncbi:YaaA family protein [Campylobacter insulaenigrae]|uniref:YaaA family protein n=1 Tax=Campylobacter insulaenigrae TaxID=260714 RepID=UPI0021527E83|nr:YaaA family protein [Campylobacter insulaenigrae]MCR6573767.1 YaaA family protein [Campylobacter insulaenigrae]MCR6575529.1 YaaA family protein [Campylobacter insulaenigrae]MCR6579726.1 YaaA family protein [Campylobacter insulaenigrae]MCR6582594.1 YaaA family protein [Campylobacter insulaenigrae]MCR6585832.1 YaaA family protein [Campylobacter insulaenigrae]
MKILFSPSEGKAKECNNEVINKKSFIFEEKYEKRVEVISKYQNYINTLNDEELKKFFDIKDDNEIFELKNDIFQRKGLKAIERYNGVAYDFLNYKELNLQEKKYVDENVIIFSNLFGPIRAGDILPYYKFKQGKKIKNFNIEKFYKDNFSKELDNFLKDEIVIDLRAKFYEKFYVLNQPYISFTFLKNSKILSHYAKAYRGVILNFLAINNIKNKKEILEKLPQNLKIKEIKTQGLKEEIILEIMS